MYRGFRMYFRMYFRIGLHGDFRKAIFARRFSPYKVGRFLCLGLHRVFGLWVSRMGLWVLHVCGFRTFLYFFYTSKKSSAMGENTIFDQLGVTPIFIQVQYL